MRSGQVHGVAEAWLPHGSRTASFADIDARVHLWRLDIGRLDAGQAGPPPDEDMAQAERRHPAGADRHRFALALGVLRRVLADVLGEDEAAPSRHLRFGDGPAGTLVLETHPRLHVALSLSDSLAVMAATRTGEIGLDVRRLRPTADMGSVVRERFDDAERGAILGCPDEMRDAVFHRILTRKDALMKVAESSRRGPADDRPGACGTGTAWTVTTLPDLHGHAAALARCRSARGLRLWSLAGRATAPMAERRARSRSHAGITP